MADQFPPNEHGSPHARDDRSQDVVSLKPLFAFLGRYRRVLGGSVAAAMLGWGALLVVLLFLLPREQTGSLEVRLLFDGAADGTYPNGTPFSPAELVATPVLSEVFRANDLEQFGSFGDFKESMTALHASLEEKLLAAAYAARLNDTKLTPTDRARLEDEFRKRREAIRDPVYALTFRRMSRMTSLPASLVEKVLNDTVAEWARQAEAVKGATRFDVSALSPDLLKPDVLDRDFLMAADDLRVTARRAADVAKRLATIPGAASFRTADDRLSVADVSFQIADTLRNDIEPTVYSIQESGLTTNARQMAQYLHGHVIGLRLERDATKARIQAFQDALQAYTSSKGSRLAREGSGESATSGRSSGFDTQTLIPQISDSFLDRLIEMSTQTQAADVQFRQSLADRLIQEGLTLAELERSTSYYEQLERNLRAGGSAGSPAEAAAVKARLKAAFDKLQEALSRLNRIYDELSAQRLDPTVALYAISRPFETDTTPAFTFTSAVLLLAVLIVLAVLGALAGCTFHHLRTRPGAARA